LYSQDPEFIDIIRPQIYCFKNLQIFNERVLECQPDELRCSRFLFEREKLPQFEKLKARSEASRYKIKILV